MTYEKLLKEHLKKTKKEIVALCGLWDQFDPDHEFSNQMYTLMESSYMAFLLKAFQKHERENKNGRN